MTSILRPFWYGFFALALLFVVWFATALLLAQPLAWLHDSNGTAAALQPAIDGLITISLAALMAAIIWRRLEPRREASRAPHAAEPSTTQPRTVPATTAVARPSTVAAPKHSTVAAAQPTTATTQRTETPTTRLATTR